MERAEAKDTVMSAGALCMLICREHRSDTLEAKNCDGLDCEECQLGKQAEISFKAGEEQGRREVAEDFSKWFEGQSWDINGAAYIIPKVVMTKKLLMLAEPFKPIKRLGIA